ncbi:hypothetical protein LJ046_06605 [Lactobacillus delbrueckii subsp. jakobsenii ZN7a-9 = DSM 26046]|nr:hypothetical protein LJ046_06605 [Lactobacillus delbrueckii subsp. jakobsenii ZN7a-9 = DSM 26046]
MSKVKLRKLGYSKGVTVPKEITPVAEKYRVYQSSDGMILYVPVSIDDSFVKFELNDIINKFKKK